MRSAAEAAPSFLYLPDLAARAEAFTLAGDEARYLARVVRARAHERVTACDGVGRVATLVVESVRPELRLRIEERRFVPAPPGARLLCGAPEGERGDWLVEKLCELGVTELVPVETQRVRWPSASRHERWERLVTAALRQSRAAWRMRVTEPIELSAALTGSRPGARWLAEPGGAAESALAWVAAGPITGAVGPSSGFSDEEHKLLESNGFIPVRLARHRLRTETAAVAMAALWAARRTADAAEP